MPRKWYFFVKNVYILSPKKHDRAHFEALGIDTLTTLKREYVWHKHEATFKYEACAFLVLFTNKLFVRRTGCHALFSSESWLTLISTQFQWTQFLFSFLLKIIFVCRNTFVDIIRCQSVYMALLIVYCLVGVSVKMFWYIIHCLGLTLIHMPHMQNFA